MRVHHKLIVTQRRRRLLCKTKHVHRLRRAVRRTARYLHARAQRSIQRTTVPCRHRRSSGTRAGCRLHEPHLVALAKHVRPVKLDLVHHIMVQVEVVVRWRIAIVDIQQHVRRW